MSPDTPTHFPSNGSTPSTVDLILNKNTSDITDPYTLSELPSDHDPILFTLNNRHTENITRTITSYKHTDWQQFRQTLDTHIHINNNIENVEQLEAEVQALTAAITHAKHKHTRTIKINTDKEHLPQNITDTITQRNNTRKQWQRSRDPQYRTQMNTLNAQIKTLLHTHRNTIFQQKLALLNPNDNSLWRMTKLFKRQHINIPTLRTNNQEHVTDSEKAEAIAKAFEQVHHIDTSHTVQQQDIITDITRYLNTPYTTSNKQLAGFLTTPSEVALALSKLPNRKAPGPDNLENEVLKNISKKL